MREEIRAEALHPPIGHYTDAVRFGDLLFLSGCGPTNERLEVVGGEDAAAQARQVYANIKSVLAAAGAAPRMCWVSPPISPISRTVTRWSPSGVSSSARRARPVPRSRSVSWRCRARGSRSRPSPAFRGGTESQFLGSHDLCGGYGLGAPRNGNVAVRSSWGLTPWGVARPWVRKAMRVEKTSSVMTRPLG